MGELVDAAWVDRWIRCFASLVTEHRDHLTELDAAVGDADHGSNMDRGMTSAAAAMGDATATVPGALLTQVGMTLVSTVGGASGPLFGTLFLRMGQSLGDASEVSAEALAAAVRAGMEGVVARGRAERGDKTMYDALAPGVEALEVALTQGAHLTEALARAGAAAAEGRDATEPMLARNGRASYLGERSVGHQDPGAASMALLFAAAATTEL